MLSGSELWLLRLMADRGLALLDAELAADGDPEERGELRVAAASGDGTPRLRVLPVDEAARSGRSTSRASRSRSTARAGATRRGCTTGAWRRAPR